MLRKLLARLLMETALLRDRRRRRFGDALQVVDILGPSRLAVTLLIYIFAKATWFLAVLAALGGLLSPRYQYDAIWRDMGLFLAAAIVWIVGWRLLRKLNRECLTLGLPAFTRDQVARL